MPRIIGAAAVVVFVLTSLCAITLADADPASDVLLSAQVFYPYSPSVSDSLQRTLDAETAAAAQARFPIKVALIDSPTDLGAIPSFFDKPQSYADFLAQELTFAIPHAELLVVMPDGYGLKGLAPSATATGASLAKPAGAQSNDLARAAILAVQKLAVAAGHPIRRLTDTSPPAAEGPRALIVVAVFLGAVVAAGAVTATRRRLSAHR